MLLIKIPCDKCLILPLCKNKQIVECNKLLLFLDKLNKRNLCPKKAKMYIYKCIIKKLSSMVYLSTYNKYIFFLADRIRNDLIDMTGDIFYTPAQRLKVIYEMNVMLPSIYNNYIFGTISDKKIALHNFNPKGK